MTKKMLIDATHEEETRVAVVDENRLIDFDYESKLRKQLKGSVFLAKVTRVEPSLQAAFVNFGGNRHGFLPFSEIHPDYFRIPVADRQAILQEQQEEMEARQAKEEDEDEDEDQEDISSDVDSIDAETEDLEEDDFVEEVGGDDVVSIDDPEIDEGSENNAEAEDDDFSDLDSSQDEKGGESALEVNEDDKQEVEAAEKPDNSEEKQDTSDKNSEETNNSSSKRRGRRRYYNKKRGRGRSMASDSRRVEVVGGDELEGERPLRPSIKRNYKIQEVVKRGQIMLIQASKEERGNKGAAVTTYMSLPGRYCVLMPNSPRAGGVSRKIANYKDRKRMRDILKELNVPEGMSVIMRTAGVERTKTEIKRDLDYLLRLWNSMRELTLKSTAPALIHEESNLIRRAIRDIYTRDINEVVVSGDRGYKVAKDFMKMMIPSHARRVKEYKDEQIPLFNRYQVEAQINEIGDHVVTLPSGGYLVINPTEALISIDVNSGRATRERHIEETALKTNLEAAEEVARQLKLRDLGGLVVIDFIDMEDRRNNRKVENKMKGALSSDRARIQIGRISSFGLMELSRQRLNPSLTDSQFKQCSHCKGAGYVRTIDSAAILALRALEDEGIKSRSSEVKLLVPNEIALYILNQKRDALIDIEKRYSFKVIVVSDDSYLPSGFQVEGVKLPSKGKSSKVDNENLDENEKGNKQKASRRRGKRGGRRRNANTNSGKDKIESNVKSESGSDHAIEDNSSDEVEKSESKSAPKKRRQRKKKPEDVKDTKKDTKVDKKARSDQEDSAVELSVVDDSKGESEKKAEKKGPKKSTKKAEKKSAKKDTKEDKKKTRAKQKPASDKKESKMKKTEALDSKESAIIEASNDTSNNNKDYEKVNEAPAKKKRGWWSKGSD